MMSTGHRQEFSNRFRRISHSVRKLELLKYRGAARVMPG